MRFIATVPLMVLWLMLLVLVLDNLVTSGAHLVAADIYCMSQKVLPV